MTPTPTEQARSPRLFRRLLTVVFGLALVGGLATACSSDNSDDSSSDNSASDDSYYPHTMSTRFGDVTIEKKPERILALSTPAADDLLSLGITPSIVSADPDSLEKSNPWIVEDIKEISVAGLTSRGETDYEKIASLDPDLIIGGITDEDKFNKLSNIATTVTANSSDNNPDWDVNLNYIAEATNKKEEAESVIKSITEKYASVGKSVSNISEKSYNWVGIGSNGKMSYGNGSLIGLFGLKANQDNGQNSGNIISAENLRVLDSDFIAIWAQDGEDSPSTVKLKNDPMFKELPAAKAGNVYWAGLPEANALNSPAPMAMEWFLEQLTPSIEALGK